MKKVYSSIALAVAVCGSVSAASFEATVAELQTSVNEIQTVSELARVENSNGMYKAAAAAKDVQGIYVENWYGRTSNENGLQTTGVQIYIDGTDVTIMGLWELAVVKGTYNPSTGVLRIPGGQSTLYTGQGGAQIKLFTDQLIVGSDNMISGEKELPYIEFEYLPEGATNSQGQTILVGGWYTDPLNQISFNVDALRGSTSGYKWIYGMQFYNTLEYYGVANFVYNESEWTDCGAASFTDGWFKAMDGQGFSAYSVDCKKNGSEILLVNPYGTESPYAKNGPSAGINWNSAPSTPGYIVLDISNPECVLVRPFVNSGFSIKNIYGFRASETSTTVTYPTEGFFACTSAEGQRYYMDGWDIEEIIDESEMYGDPLPTLKGNVVSLPNCRIQGPEEGYLLAAQWLTSSNLPIPMETEIVLPDAALAAVEGIINDADNAAPRYFNLQGLEIANPEAGELVIVKQGNKTTKTIVK